MLCEPRDLNTLEDRSFYNPDISRFHFSQKTCKILEKLQTLRKSQLFTDMWQEYARSSDFLEEVPDASDGDSGEYESAAERDCSEDFCQDAEEEVCYAEDCEDESQEETEEECIDGPSADDHHLSVYNQIVGDVVKFVWTPFMKKWNQLKTSLMDGAITVERTESLLDRFQGDYKKIISELELILEDSDKAKERLEQIELLAQVDATINGAEVILKAKKEFKIKGDFSELETLVDLVRFFYFFP